MPSPNPPSADSITSLTEVIAEGLDELSLEASKEQVGQLAQLSELLGSWAKRINLTAHRTPGAVARRLVLDAAAMLSVVPDFESIADLGSGAGFPGLPIAILRPQVQVTLVEARERRHHFQRAAVREIGISNAEPLRGRIEQLPAREHDAVVAQAVGPWAEVVALMIPWSKPGGTLILPAGKQAPSRSPDERAQKPRVLRYSVPLGGSNRQVWLAERAS